MNRRDFLKAISASTIIGGFAPNIFAEYVNSSPNFSNTKDDFKIKKYIKKMQNYKHTHIDDKYIDKSNLTLFITLINRLIRLQSIIGYGKFHLISIDEASKIAKNYSYVGMFSKKEFDLIEQIFYMDAAVYGFYGEKPIDNLTYCVDKRSIIKIPKSGNYLYQGAPLKTYNQIKTQIGEQVILTSGVRSVLKQLLLFLNKVRYSHGNLSLASRVLAPPGYSFHGISDFDVGQAGLGAANFTTLFTKTKVFNKLNKLGYIKLRYPKNNFLGVRYEPWHIKVDS